MPQVNHPENDHQVPKIVLNSESFGSSGGAKCFITALQGGAPKIAKLAHATPINMLYR